jgi:hypothetical protein
MNMYTSTLPAAECLNSVSKSWIGSKATAVNCKEDSIIIKSIVHHPDGLDRRREKRALIGIHTTRAAKCLNSALKSLISLMSSAVNRKDRHIIIKSVDYQPERQYRRMKDTSVIVKSIV